MSDSHYQEWVKYPTGKLGKGVWCNHCKRYTARHSTVEVILIRDHKILLVLRDKNPQKGWWALPGGYVEWDETLEQAVRRELSEEIKIKISNLKFLGIYSDPNRDLDDRQNLAHCFIAQDVQGNGQVIDHREIAQTKWFDLHHLPDNIAVDHRKMIEDYIKNKKQ